MYILFSLTLVLIIHCFIFYFSDKRYMLCEFYNKLIPSLDSLEHIEDQYNYTELVNKNTKEDKIFNYENSMIDSNEFNKFKLNQNLKLLEIIGTYEKYFEQNPKVAKKIFVETGIHELRFSVETKVLELSRHINQSRVA